MNEEIQLLFEQFKDIYTGRATYNNDEEWVANMDASLEELCDAAGFPFQPQEKQ